MDWLQKARYYSSAGALYAATLLFAWFLFHPLKIFGSYKPIVYSQTPVIQTNSVPSTTAKKIVSGKPVRIVIKEADNGLNIDLPVVDGVYDEQSASWSLSEQSAHYALVSVPANDTAGNTFIYGHSSKYVFGYLLAIHENAGATAQVYTANGHVFSYSYSGSAQLDPGNTSVFSDKGPPRLTVQTCSGNFYEYRQMFYFTFQKVEN